MELDEAGLLAEDVQFAQHRTALDGLVRCCYSMVTVGAMLCKPPHKNNVEKHGIICAMQPVAARAGLLKSPCC